MALEGKMSAVAPQLFTLDGTPQGVITVADTAGFRTKQVAYLTNNTLPNLAVQVKRVLSPTKLIVGAVDNKIASWMPLDISGYTVASGASVGAEEQPKNNIPQDDHYRAIYESDPVVADRIVFVDKYGNFYDNTNPLPIIFDGTVSIGEVAIVGNPNPLYDQSPGSITTSGFNTIYTYTSSNDKTRVKLIEVTVSTPALVQVLLNGLVIKERWTSPMDRNALFSFEEPRQLLTGDVLTINAKVDRFIWPTFETFTSWEGYLQVV